MSERKVQPQIGEARTKLVVMKFGGTSVEDAKAMLRTAEIVRGRRERGLSPMVVVSAMANVTSIQVRMARAAASSRQCARSSMRWMIYCAGSRQWAS